MHGVGSALHGLLHSQLEDQQILQKQPFPMLKEMCVDWSCNRVAQCDTCTPLPGKALMSQLVSALHQESILQGNFIQWNSPQGFFFGADARQNSQARLQPGESN